MRLVSWRISILGIVGLCLLVAACRPTSKASVNYQPPLVPVTFSINSSGDVTVSVSGKVETPVGQFGVGGALSNSFKPPSDATLVVIETGQGDQVQTARYTIGATGVFRVCTTGDTATSVSHDLVQIANSGGGTVTIGCTSQGGSAPSPDTLVASDFSVFGQSHGSFDVSGTGSELDVGSPSGPDQYSALWGAYSRASSCFTSISFYAQVSPPAGNSPGYGYAIGLGDSVQDDQPNGGSLQVEWDDSLDGFFTRPVDLPAGAWEGGGSVPGLDITQRHYVEVSRAPSGYLVTIDGQSAGGFSGPQCGELIFRVWGGATASFSQMAASEQ
jgi:hypothetical protein